MGMGMGMGAAPQPYPGAAELTQNRSETQAPTSGLGLTSDRARARPRRVCRLRLWRQREAVQTDGERRDGDDCRECWEQQADLFSPGCGGDG
eukprot:scaffold5696_cov119-Isochrysis_galbana.AAC.16